MHTKTHLKLASEVPVQDFLQALNTAYSDYFVPIRFDAPSFAELIERDAIRTDLSAAALRDGEAVGIGMLAVRGLRGWIAGMGVAPEFRRQGIGRELMRYLIDQARRSGLESVQLEVITENTPAYALYESLSFKTVRLLHVMGFQGEGSEKGLPPIPDGLLIEERPAELLMDGLAALQGVRSPWQREADSHRAILDRLRGFVASGRPRGSPVGICLYANRGDSIGLLDLIAPDAGTGEALLGRLIGQFPSGRMSYLNVPEEDPMYPVLVKAGFQVRLSQWEMFLHFTQEAGA